MRRIFPCLLAWSLLATITGCRGGGQYLAATKPLVEQYQQALGRLSEFEKQPYSTQQATLDFYQKYSQDMVQIKTGFCLQASGGDKKLSAFHADLIRLLDIADLMAQSISNDLLRYQTVIAGTKFKNASQRRDEVRMISDKWENKAIAAREAYSAEQDRLASAISDRYQFGLAPVGSNPLIADLKKTFK
jgi:hypothetical protein